ncbi:hypothetical protein SMKI_06G3020 [Saccharomyces mikatae IFO 1815]|uniref:Prm3p n=1 Tax=Saccharomyces mikatae IFO 1815 TaxID=226126 RepID=A0AA35IXU1_SACMI|nr:uncharacterized protein SMKI_06G3020 [Saccharomyces mikatae IFO 1815]CAI4038950.1 hypothetical protein SMKI_06G3020 [Saccharomyces mikatae IFO 1815]
MSGMKKENTMLDKIHVPKRSKEHKENDENLKLVDEFLMNETNNRTQPNKKPLINNKSYIKKSSSPGRVKKNKTITSPMKSRPKSKKKDATESKTQKENKGSFYQGAIFGSFLGAAVTTVLSNLAVKALQN